MNALSYPYSALSFMERPWGIPLAGPYLLWLVCTIPDAIADGLERPLVHWIIADQLIQQFLSAQPNVDKSHPDYPAFIEYIHRDTKYLLAEVCGHIGRYSVNVTDIAVKRDLRGLLFTWNAHGATVLQLPDPGSLPGVLPVHGVRYG